MKLQTKLTLWITGLLLLMTAALTAALFLISDTAEQATARSTLESAVSSCAAELLTGRGRGLRGYIGRTYDNGAYLQVYSGDGSTLEAGTDIFGIQSMMPDLLQNNEQEQVFRVTTAEANVYCYFLRLSGVKNERGRGGKTGTGGRTDRGKLNGRGGTMFSGEQESVGEAGTSDEIDGSGETDFSGETDGSAGFDGSTGSDTRAGSGTSVNSDGTAGTDDIWIVGLLPEDSMANVTTSVVRLTCAGLAVIVFLAALGSCVIIGRSLRPLRRITESAREITDGSDLSRRIQLSPGRDEVHELADTFNDMMGRLERSFDAERRFTSDASHELRTPVTVILAECEMAEKMPEDTEAVQESVTEIHKQARKMSELIGKLLAYTRLEQGTRRIDREELDLSGLVEDVCEEQRTVAARNIKIECEASPDVLVNGDVALLISLVQNLVTNAVKYGKDGGHVWVKVYSEGSKACVSVRDDGIGIGEEDLACIWNRFYQADRSRSDESRGIGLGLSLAQQIARLHGGRITASSRPGEGSEFIFSMPEA
ncbi:MAG: HAMP domain-containing sensor histidine kinase [Lachnospiraceae bacterium]|nr:HAMP domain-containing sensor histidine kinase [Lachnospiraceae bacterium]